MKRRSFVFLSLAPLVCSRAFPRQWRSTPAEILRAGPMLGYSTATEVAIWLQTTRSAFVQIRYWLADKPTSSRVTREVSTDGSKDLIARFTIGALEPGSRYEYEVYLDGLRVEVPHRLAFQTQAIWQFRTAPPPARFAIGSCAYVNDSAFDRPGDPYGGNMEIFTAIAGAAPDAMVWLGDNWYYREGDFFSERGMRYRASHTRSLREMQALLGSAHQYAIWDDHDYGDNDSDRSSPTRDTALSIFKDYWANPMYGTSDAPGVFQRFTWSDVEFFLLDDRSYRTPNVEETDPRRQMFGDVQMRWLMDSLASSPATFKIVAGGNQMLNPLTFFEAFGRFPAEQKRLLDFIRDQRVNGVVFLSGDRHHTELIRRTDRGMYPLYDFTSSALTSQGGRLAEEEHNPARVADTWVTGTRNFGLVEVSGPAKERTLALRTLDYSGKELWKHQIAAAEIRFETPSH